MKIELNNRQHCGDFIRLNEAWISHYFVLEEADKKLAVNPYQIVEQGGCILSLVDAGKVVGVCALFKEEDHRYQLARMAVDDQARGKGYGDKLMQAALAQAHTMGAHSLYLLSNTKLQPALALYRKYGFQTLSEGPHPVYARSDITMELWLINRKSE
ncbi:MAG: GNAT family N-acetyltransferase [Undibacterium sp.]|nr:GNAT family N-acetyltransferase [Undibacterium sp.]